MERHLDDWLEKLAQSAQADLETRNAARDRALVQSRELIRDCSTAIRSAHRDEWPEAQTLLAQADTVAAGLRTTLAPYPDLFYAGYTQDALKELVEAHVTLALVAGTPPPFPDALGVPYSTYLNGACEAASELRRRCLDAMRQSRMEEAERLLSAMDAVYDLLISFDYPDAITGGLRHRVDQLRGVLERTRGDLTNGLQAERLMKALSLGRGSSARKLSTIAEDAD